MNGVMADPRAMNDHEAIEWEGALIHHSATSPTVTVKQIRDYHMKKRGWFDIGYHGLITFESGEWAFAEGRPLSMPGAHCPGKNQTHLGLCLIGNFMHSTPPIAQLEVAATVLAEWCIAFDFGPEDICAHRQYRHTECPGLVDILDIRHRVSQLLTHG